ncbi:MAG: tyrosine-type recombinase/integrase [Acetatifactor sp.]|nr:tyrosine-type recombinase/integrase [Acetatifactor sp.]
MTIAQADKLFMEDRAVYCSVKTLRSYACHLQVFYQYLEMRYRQPMTLLEFGSLPQEDNIYSGFILFQRGRVKNSTVRSYCRTIKVFLRWCYEEDYCRDYLKKVKLPRDDAIPKMPLYTDEVAAIDSVFDVQTIKGIRNYCIFHLMLDCGLRREEVTALKVEHLDSKRNLLSVEISKGMKSRIVLVPDFLLDAVNVYLRQNGHASGFLFRSLRSGTPITDNTVKQMFQNLKAESGVQRVHAHLLRHTFATSYLIGGGNLEFLRVFLGHTDYNVTKVYSQLAAKCKMLGVDVYQLDPIFFTRGY